MKHSYRLTRLAASLTALCAGSLMASGYHFGTQSVAAQSTANASASEAADPSTVFYNGAGLLKLEGTQATVNLDLVLPSVQYLGAKAYYPPTSAEQAKAEQDQPETRVAVAGEDHGNIRPAAITAVPHVYVSHKVDDKFALGFGLYVPFGSGTEYQQDSVLRYNMNKLNLKSLAFQPTIAFKFSEKLSFAVGFVAQHTEAQLRQFANFGPAVLKGVTAKAVAASLKIPKSEQDASENSTLFRTVVDKTKAELAKRKANGDTSDNDEGLSQMLPVLAAYHLFEENFKNDNSGKVGNGLADGIAEVKGGGWGFGYTLSWLYDINDKARVGVNYRSAVKQDLKGEAKWDLRGGVLADKDVGFLYQAALRDAGYAKEEKASVSITTPESLSVHAQYQVEPRLTVFGDITRTRHSRFNRADLRFEHEKTVADAKVGDTNANREGTQSYSTVLAPRWRDTWKVALGASYQLSELLQLRAGLAYDQSPVRSADLRLSTLPDANRMWFSFGAKYQLDNKHTLNFAYSFLKVQGSRAYVNGFGDVKVPGEKAIVSSQTYGNVQFKSHAHILGLQYTYKF